MSDATQYLVFDAMSQPVRLQGCGELVERIGVLFSGWPIASDQPVTARPVLNVTHDGDAYRFAGDWLREPLVRQDLASAASALVAEVMRAWARDGNRWLCLHGAAANFGGRLVVFPSQYRAGKSLLSTALAAAGVPIYADDVLPIRIDDGLAMAPGLAPRLRLPLPENLGRTTRDYVDRHRAFGSAKYLYLDLAGRELAARGELAPVGGFVLLEREIGVAPVLEPVPAATVLKQVVWQNFSRQAEAPRILDALGRLVAQARRYRLRYDRVEEAVALLRDEFGRWSLRTPNAPGNARPSRPGRDESSALRRGQLRRRFDIEMREVDDECFLADLGGAAIHHLNPIGRAVWTLLARPIGADEIAAVVASAFPDIERERIEQDLGDLISVLKRKGLIEQGDDDGPGEPPKSRCG